MTDKEKQEAQEVTPQDYEQMAFFTEPTPAEAAAETIAAIKRTLLEAEAIRNSPGYRATDLLMKMDEAAILAERCSRPGAIKTVCQSAAADAAALAKSTGNPAFDNIAERLTAVAAAAVLQQDAERHVIHINTTPDIDMNMTAEELEQASARLHEAFDGLMKKYSENFKQTTAVALDAIRPALENISGTISLVAAFTQSEAFKTIRESLAGLRQYIEEHRDIFDRLSADYEGTQRLFPFIQQEIDALNAANPDKPPITLDNVLVCMAPNGEPIEDESGIENPYKDLIARAKARKADMDAAQEIADTAAQIEADLPLLQSIIPDKHTMPNNALMNKMQKAPAINAGEFDLIVSGEKGKRREITTLVKLCYDETQTGIALTGANMTEYERQVSDALISLWLYGDASHIMTADMIYRTMTGQSSSSVKASQGQKAAITKFMNKWGSVRVTVDCSEEMRKRGITDKNGKAIKQFLFDEYYLNTRRVQVKTGSETVTAWQLISKPVILQYCEMTKQLLTVPAKMLDIKEVTTGGHSTTVSVQNNADRIAVKGNLLRKIKTMQGKKHNKQEWSNIISFDTVLEEIGLQDADKKKRQQIRDYAFNCLDYWKAEHFIAGYKQRTKGRAITGVEIDL